MEKNWCWKRINLTFVVIKSCHNNDANVLFRYAASLLKIIYFLGSNTICWMSCVEIRRLLSRQSRLMEIFVDRMYLIPSRDIWSSSLDSDDKLNARQKTDKVLRYIYCSRACGKFCKYPLFKNIGTYETTLYKKFKI